MEGKAQHQSDFSERSAVFVQVEQCFRQLPISLAVNLINAAIIAAVLWGVVGSTRVIAWLVLMVLVSGARYWLLHEFRKAGRDALFALDRWTQRFVYGACGAGVAWGVAGVLLFPHGQFPYQVFLAFVVGGMIAGAIPLLSAIGHAYRCFAIPAALPISLQMLAVGDRIHLIMGAMILIYFVAMLTSSVLVKRLFDESDRLRRELWQSAEAAIELEQMLRLDVLTGIANRRLFEEELDKEWRRSRRQGDTLSVITADIDHFKEYNDHYGHPAGDRCLVSVAQTMQQALSRPGDIVARIGGEEFAFVLPRTTLNGAKSVAEQVRERVLALKLPHAASPDSDQVTLSYGIACSDQAGIETPADLLGASDTALYEAKRRGRNRIVVKED